MQQWIRHPQAKATEKRPFTYKGEKTYVDGRQLLQEAISLGEESGFANYSFVLYASAPYGILVEEGGGKRGNSRVEIDRDIRHYQGRCSDNQN